jgi:rhamnogalacturonan endolyase
MPRPARLALALFTLLAPAAARARADAACPVAVEETPEAITLTNGRASFTVAKTGPRAGMVTSIKGRVRGALTELGAGSVAMNYDFDNHNKAIDRGHVSLAQGSAVALAAATPEMADVQVTHPPSQNCPFSVEQHYLLRQDDPGFYFYVRLEHTADQPACTFEQLRAVIRPVRGADLFTHYIVDDARKGPYPAGPILATVSDSTWQYAFDNQIHSKYDYSNFIADDLVHGVAGPGVGMWLIQPSREYVNGGPLRQELTVHQDSPTNSQQNNILLWMMAGNHFGGPNTAVAAGQAWSHVYGPAFLYLNEGDTTDALWADAQRKAADEVNKWPYAFVAHPDYPLARGTVKVSSGDSPAGAWVVLAPAGDRDWCMSASGYEFWTRADAAGHFVIPKVRPGRYALHVCGANQFEDYFQDGLDVPAGDTDLGTVRWAAVTHGQTLWQIGRPDRSTREFKDGQNCRHFTNATRYATTFPEDVTFTVGKSREAEDWNFAQFGVYVKKPYWSVVFDQPTAGRGKGTLTIALAAFQSPGLTVRLNGTELGVVKFPKSGMAFYRSGGQDSLRQTAVLPFDGSLIKAGRNELQLELKDARQVEPGTEVAPNMVGGAMYDAIRLEVE